MPTPLATIDDVAAALGQDPADPTNLKLTNAILAASDIVRNYTGQRFDLVEDDEVQLSGTGTRHIQLPQVRVLGVTTVVEHDYLDQIVAFPPTYHTRLDMESGLLHRTDDVWCIGDMNYTVTYSHGFLMPGVDYDSPPDEATSLPDIVVEVTAAIAANLFALDPTGGLVASERIGNYNVSYTTGAAQAGGGHYEATLAAVDRYRVIDAA